MACGHARSEGRACALVGIVDVGAHGGDEVACIELVAAIATWRAISEVARCPEIPPILQEDIPS